MRIRYFHELNTNLNFNSKRIFEENNLENKNHDTLETLLIGLYGEDWSYNRVRELNFPLQILQIGTGPYHNSQDLDPFYLGKLRYENFRLRGAGVTNLDVCEENKTFFNGAFQLGNWKDINQIFTNYTFDVIFVEDMHHKPDGFENTIAFQKKLLRDTISKLNPGGLFIMPNLGDLISGDIFFFKKEVLDTSSQLKNTEGVDSYLFEFNGFGYESISFAVYSPLPEPTFPLVDMMENI